MYNITTSARKDSSRRTILGHNKVFHKAEGGTATPISPGVLGHTDCQ